MTKEERLKMENMTVEELKTKTETEIMDFIRYRLSFDEFIKGSFPYKDETKNVHKRFDMSGYECKTGGCTLWNNSILNEFADLGIYDYTSYLFLDFYKGTPTLYLKYFHENENYQSEDWTGNYGNNIFYFSYDYIQ